MERWGKALRAGVNKYAFGGDGTDGGRPRPPINSTTSYTRHAAPVSTYAIAQRRARAQHQTRQHLLPTTLLTFLQHKRHTSALASLLLAPSRKNCLERLASCSAIGARRPGSNLRVEQRRMQQWQKQPAVAANKVFNSRSDGGGSDDTRQQQQQQWQQQQRQQRQQQQQQPHRLWRMRTGA